MAYTLRESNKIIVVTPDNADTRSFVEWWCENNPGFPAADLWPEKMPELSFMNVPNLCQYIRFMKDDEEVEDYLSTSDIGYNPSIPDIYVAINFDSYPFRFDSKLPSFERFLTIERIGRIQSVLIKLMFRPCILRNCRDMISH